MKSLCLAALIGLFACQLAYAADDAAGTPKAARQAPRTADAPSAAQSARPIKMSQQDRMRLCSKEATGKKGAERKTFMKSCLTTKKS
ncbi:MAG TPA: PsiF family protein [Casimicrobiaceae bacterium]|nr:PsiF family protein [Casimicrobiaceae bacterium]